MPLRVTRLRRWFAGGAIAVALLVTATYFYAHLRALKALKQVPGKIGIEIQQSAQGFTISKSEQGRTIFKIQAGRAVQYKKGGHAELHDVAITIYGSDSTRFDQVYGADFDYDPRSGDVVSRGEVDIELQANPQGALNPDQTPPKELKNPIHVRTSDLVFNQKTGNAFTNAKVEFNIPQASGSALGVSYVAKTGVLDLRSQVHVMFTGQTPADIAAERGTIRKEPREVVLYRPRVTHAQETSTADEATLILRPDNKLERVLANGNVQIGSEGPRPTRTQADQLELIMATETDALRVATFTGNVKVESSGAEPAHGQSEKLVINFTGKNVVADAHAEGRVHLEQQQSAQSSASAQNLELTAPVIDFLVAGGRHLKSAETSGPPQIAIRPADAAPGAQTLVTATKLLAYFDANGRISSLHGAPNARIVNSATGQPDRISTSDLLDVVFRPGSGIESVVQQGNLAYADGERKAWAKQGRYTPIDQMLVLSGAPRVVDQGMTTTAVTMRMNRATGDAFAEGDVRSTYSDLKPQPDGALLASSSPIHVTSRTMTAHRSPGVAVYEGQARLWQDANIVEAPWIQFDRDHRSVVARGSPNQRVSTVIVQVEANGNVTPVSITSSQLTYSDADRRIHFEGGVIVKGQDSTLTANEADVFLHARGAAPSTAAIGQSRLDHMLAKGRVVIDQPNRRGTGDQLVYTADDEKFVLTGGPPSIFDAERGKITGVSLTFFRTDDRVLVEGSDSSPTVTHTRVAH